MIYDEYTQMKPDNFFDQWSNDMAWVLGYFAADGSMYRSKRGSYYIDFTSIDRELLEWVKKLMLSLNKIEIYQPKNRNNHIRYHLQIGSKHLYNQLLKLGITPRKSRNILLPYMPNQYFGHFLRGYFDGDGNTELRLDIRKNRKDHIYPYMSIKLTSGSYLFLKQTQHMINQLFLISGGTLFRRKYQGHYWYVLAYSTRNVLKLYNFMYPKPGLPCLLRKKLILDKGIKVIGIEV